MGIKDKIIPTCIMHGKVERGVFDYQGKNGTAREFYRCPDCNELLGWVEREEHQKLRRRIYG